MSSFGFQQKSAEQLSLEGHKLTSYADIDESCSNREKRHYHYGTGPRDNSGHEEGTAEHQDRAWYYGEGENGEERLERKKKCGVVHRYIDLDKPEEKSTE